MAPASHSPETPNRPTRIRRSRYGCRNCKIRKLKCDETKPQCKKCVFFKVICNYMSNLPDLEPAIPAIPAAGHSAGSSVASRMIRGRHLTSPRPRPPISSAVWTSNESGSYRFDVDARSQTLVSRYFGENMVGSYEPNMGGVYRKLLRLAVSYPFLMHACIAGALAYDRYMHMISTSQRFNSQRFNGSCTPRGTVEECYLSQSTVLLSKHLNGLVSKTAASGASDAGFDLAENSKNNRDRRDSVWGTASLLALVTFSSSASSLDASEPEDSWPLVGLSRPAVSSPPWPSTVPITPYRSGNIARVESRDTIKKGAGSRREDAEEQFNWSAMTNSKLSLWSFVQPLREDSIFSVVAPTFAEMNFQLPGSGIDRIFPELTRICGLTSDSNAETSPYFLAAHAVAHLYHANGDSIVAFHSKETSRGKDITGNSPGDRRSFATAHFDNETTNPPHPHTQPHTAQQKHQQADQRCVKIGSTKVFTRIVTGAFESLLRDRDPVALLLLYLWHSKARKGIWWIELRARVEVPAICLYLRRYHSEREDILGFLANA